MTYLGRPDLSLVRIAGRHQPLNLAKQGTEPISQHIVIHCYRGNQDKRQWIDSLARLDGGLRGLAPIGSTDQSFASTRISRCASTIVSSYGSG